MNDSCAAIDVKGREIWKKRLAKKKIDISVLVLPAILLILSDICAQEPKEIFRKVSNAVVYISQTQRDGGERFGSGFIIDPEGVILTSQHIVTGASQINLKLKDGTVYYVTGIIYNNAKLDVCLLKIDAHALPVVILGDSKKVEIGEKVYAIGNPAGFDFTFSDGMLSGIRDIQNVEVLQFSAPVSSGSSGGPLLDSQGQVIGIIAAGSADGGEINFAVAIDEVKPFITATAKLKPGLPPVFNKAEEYYVEGRSLFLRQDYDQALGFYQKAIDIDPDYAEAYNDRGNIYEIKGDYEQAFLDYNKAIQITPNLALSYFNRGNIYYHKGSDAEAISDYNDAIKIDPNIYDCYVNRGNVYSREGNYDQAISDYNKAIEMNPNFGDAYYNRAIIYCKRKEFDRAWNDVRKAESLGYIIKPVFLEILKKASGRDK